MVNETNRRRQERTFKSSRDARQTLLQLFPRLTPRSRTIPFGESPNFPRQLNVENVRECTDFSSSSFAWNRKKIGYGSFGWTIMQPKSRTSFIIHGDVLLQAAYATSSPRSVYGESRCEVCYTRP